MSSKDDFKYIVIVVFISVIVSLFVSVYLNKVRETDIWKKTSVEAIYTIGELEKANKNQANFIKNMAVDLKTIRNTKVDSILNKYGIK
jgi:hypothetical protein